MYFIVDAAGRIESVNAFGAGRLGYDRGELIGQSVLSVIVEPDRASVEKNAAACLQEPGRMRRWEARKVRKDGTRLWMRETARAVVLNDRPLLLIAGEDITDRKRAEGELRLEWLYGANLASSLTLNLDLPDRLLQVASQFCPHDAMSVMLIDQQGSLRVRAARGHGPDADRKLLQGSAFRPEAFPLIARVLRDNAPVLVADTRDEPDWIAVRGAEQARSWLATPLVAGESVIGLLAIHKAQPRFFTAEHQHVAEALAAPAAVAIQNARPHEEVQTHARLEPRVTELSRTERALRRSQAYLTAAQRLGHTGSWGYDARDDRMTYWSEELFRLYERDPQEGPPSRTAVLDCFHPDDRESTRELYETVIREKVAWDHHVRLLLPDGTLRYVRGEASPVLDTEGNLVEFVGMVMDLTEQKRALNALSEAQAQLAHVARVTTLGEVTASLAHEVNQPLAAVVNNATACLNVLPEGREMDELRAALEDIARDGTRAAAIVERVRGLAKRSYPEKTRVHLADVVGDVLKLIASESAARDVAIRTDVDPDLPSVLADRVQLQQVLLNLVVNGMDAMSAVTDGERVLEIRACAEAHDGSTAALISVSDRGTGLAPDEMDRVFQAFYTTKPDGMGMGLAISRSIIEAHDGRLWAERNPDHGATFTFRLPAAPGAAS
jgi:PAS domain S-box-containing protein